MHCDRQTGARASGRENLSVLSVMIIYPSGPSVNTDRRWSTMSRACSSRLFSNFNKTFLQVTNMKVMSETGFISINYICYIFYISLFNEIQTI